LGDDEEIRTVGVPSRVLAKSYFAVGELKRWPPWETTDVKFAMYWIGELP
jgi:hypothetical protein